MSFLFHPRTRAVHSSYGGESTLDISLSEHLCSDTQMPCKWEASGLNIVPLNCSGLSAAFFPFIVVISLLELCAPLSSSNTAFLEVPCGQPPSYTILQHDGITCFSLEWAAA